MNIEQITFRQLCENDLPLMFKWLNRPHVSEWYKLYGKKFPSLEDVRKKYLPRINGEEPTACYLIIYDDMPIGYMQSYRIDYYPAHKEIVDVNQDCAGIDIFIGEEDYVHRGLGSTIIKKFLQEFVFIKYDVTDCIIDPDLKNEVAIKCYNKAGFKHLKTIWNHKDGVWAYVMSINRDKLMSKTDTGDKLVGI